MRLEQRPASNPTAGRDCSLSLYLPLLPLIPFVSPTS